jgi:hypothetical protein
MVQDGKRIQKKNLREEDLGLFVRDLRSFGSFFLKTNDDAHEGGSF